MVTNLVQENILSNFLHKEADNIGNIVPSKSSLFPYRAHVLTAFTQAIVDDRDTLDTPAFLSVVQGLVENLSRKKIGTRGKADVEIDQITEVAAEYVEEGA